MAVVIELSPEQEASLERRAAQRGLDPANYARQVLERDLNPVPTLDELLAPFRRQVEDSGLSDSELHDLFEEAREEAFRGRLASS